MIITREIQIDMGHRLPNHKSKCRFLHGHRYKIQVSVNGEVIKKEGVSDEGMVADFSDVKEIMMNEIHDTYDHACMLSETDPLIGVLVDSWQGDLEVDLNIVQVSFIPTAENIAKHFFEILKIGLERKNLAIVSVKVWETPNCFATYHGEEN